MAEPYVPIATHTTYAALVTELEVSTNEAQPNTALLNTAQTTALTSKTTAETLLAQKFNYIFLVGA
jgi:hypothetical protein